MKILLSAYACEPNKGSEQGVGWGWATELAKTNDVWVLTRDRNQERIEKYLSERPEYQLPGLHFIYVGVSKTLTFWKKGNRGIRLYYMLWQKAAYKEAKKWHDKIGFDYVHHVTFVSYTQPTYLYKLGVPLIWGPVSGGENIPDHISIEMTPKESFIEMIRKMSQTAVLWSESIKKTMQRSILILAATEETKHKIPKKYWNKTYVIPAIGLDRAAEKDSVEINGSNIKKIVMAGRLIYWKAFDIGIRAFINIAEEFEGVELHILGQGNKKKELMGLAGIYLDKRIFFDGTVSHDEIYDYYKGFDLFLNTTLRDSGCMTMMEALSVGVPCIALDTGGPHVLGQENPSVELVQVSDYQRTVVAVSDKLKQCLSAEREVRKNTIEQTSFENKVEKIGCLLRRQKND